MQCQIDVVRFLPQALREFEPEDQRAFLRFVTSVSRAPLLGFKYLEPQLCIQVPCRKSRPVQRARMPPLPVPLCVLLIGQRQGLSHLSWRFTTGCAKGHASSLSVGRHRHTEDAECELGYT